MAVTPQIFANATLPVKLNISESSIIVKVKINNAFAFGERWWLFIIGIAFIILTAYLLFKKGNYFNAIQESPAAKAVLLSR